MLIFTDDRSRSRLFDDDNGSGSGSAYLFDISDPANPVQLFKLLPDDGEADDRFGGSVGISGATVIVGARQDDDNGFQSGSAYLFDISNPANPVQLAKLLASDGAAGDWFGFKISISGDLVIVSAYSDEDNGDDSGSAYLFDATTGEQLFKLLPDDGRAGDSFGIFVGISGSTAIVGTDQGDNGNGINSGSAYLFDAGGTPACPADLDGNGDVGFGDILAILSAWGNKGGPDDLDESGFVDFGDLLIVLAAWGPCKG